MKTRRASISRIIGFVVAGSFGCGSNGGARVADATAGAGRTAAAGGTAGTSMTARGGATAPSGAASQGGNKAAGGSANNAGRTSSDIGGAESKGGASTALGGSSAQGGSSSTVGGATNRGGSSGSSAATGGTGGIGGTPAVVGTAPRWVGRVDATNSNAVRFAWQGAGFVAIVTGGSIAVKLRTENTSVVYFQPVIDGKPGTRFKVDSGTDQVVSLATDLPDADHLVELYRETEGMYGISTFLGFTSGSVKGAPAASGRRIEVVGDSISAGYGNLGSEPHPNWVATPACSWTAANSSWYSTYASIAGRALDAEVSSIARSGWGMVRDLAGNASGVLSSVYENALGTGDASPWSFQPKASVVVVNLGTNDWAKGDPGVAYETAYVSFIAKLRSHYPDAWIFLTIGSMLGEPSLTQVKTRLANVVATVRATTADQKLATFDLGTQNLGADGMVPSGCDWHPNVADHQRMANLLQQQLTSKLGW